MTSVQTSTTSMRCFPSLSNPQHSSSSGTPTVSGRRGARSFVFFCFSHVFVLAGWTVERTSLHMEQHTSLHSQVGRKCKVETQYERQTERTLYHFTLIGDGLGLRSISTDVGVGALASVVGRGCRNVGRSGRQNGETHIGTICEDQVDRSRAMRRASDILFCPKMGVFEF